MFAIKMKSDILRERLFFPRTWRIPKEIPAKALFIKLLVSVVAGLVVSIVVYEFLKLAYAAIKFLHPTYSDK